ncbi:MAG: M48 family metallopeptidase [Polyangiaceae bacterium]|nr:M48 family metallopeptidase [Polyangiaceae bacterium]MCE7891235.1 M48 family peptidase [Sorangiineae bacterium PRO1]MCL4754156.1 M48 family metallopeptidase [Myxococcales bacterium]
MARVESLDFQKFVDERKQAHPGASSGESSHAYAYAWDKKTRVAFETMKPVELAVAAGVRMFKHIGKAELLGHAVKVGPRQFPRVLALAERCGSTLGIATPTLYVVNNPQMNAATYGTNDDSFIMIHSGLVDHLSDDELMSVIGHECGHIHNNHVVYLTALFMLTRMAGLFLRYASLPAVLALRAWSRRAEITCDRAGALCARDLDVASRALTKLALGSQKLYEELNIEAFLEQHEEAQGSVGRFSEVFATHPWLPKRVLALREFGQSSLFRQHVGKGDDGLSMEQVDEKVHEIVKVLG